MLQEVDVQKKPAYAAITVAEREDRFEPMMKPGAQGEDLFSLREILSADSDESAVSKDFSTFKCERDSDVERFLKEDAIPPL